MINVALASEGAQVALSTSSDDDHPPENIIDGMDETFWTTTGLFPQEVVIRFPNLSSIDSVEICSYNVQNIALETSGNENADSFEPLFKKVLQRTDHSIQKEEISAGGRKAHSIRLLIDSGFDHFVAVYNLKVNGNPLHG